MNSLCNSEEKFKIKSEVKIMRKKRKVMLLILCTVLALGTLTGCGGSSNSIEGHWEDGSRGEFWEFFPDGTFVLTRSHATFMGSWTSNDNRVVISGLRDRTITNGNVSWINGSHNFTATRNALTIEFSETHHREFTRVD